MPHCEEISAREGNQMHIPHRSVSSLSHFPLPHSFWDGKRCRQDVLWCVTTNARLSVPVLLTQYLCPESNLWEYPQGHTVISILVRNQGFHFAGPPGLMGVEEHSAWTGINMKMHALISCGSFWMFFLLLQFQCIVKCCMCDAHMKSFPWPPSKHWFEPAALILVEWMCPTLEVS